ncbi:putative sodium-coupled neutral amino acid transporter 11 isoform X2 [Silurus meridionalis]|uniref:putative sodium-coupled neutral amino acid transporter 11 isoform X2 n=1 Tax=Silurus meridionalis TaxID=175797 RepID=UPI001EEBEC5D|nr:putative sodium-coupled neutral amino acid transporter 11 isoform X2 [Silurus meridionalis]
MEKRSDNSTGHLYEDEKSELLPPHVEHTKGGTSSKTSASFNFINSILGSGLIGLPFSMAQAGLPLGLLLLFLVAFITDFSIILLIKGGNLSGTHSYQSLVYNTFGFVGYVILSVLQFLYPFIAMISYNIITGDTMTKVFQGLPGVGPGHILAERQFVILASTLLFTIPLSLFRNMERLGKVSLVSMLLTLAIIVIVAVRAVTLGPQIPPSKDAWVFAQWNAIQAVGVMSFAFICHHNSFMIYGSLKEPSLNNWSRITHVSVGSAALVSALFAATGYATFTGYTQGDIFENYCKYDNLATFGRFCYGLSIITTFPLECFVTREVVSNVFFNGLLSSTSHIVVTLVIILAAAAISLSYDCLGVVLELNGVLCATPLIFIIPSACFLKLSSGRCFQMKKLMPLLILIAGVFVMIVGLIMTGLSPQDCSHGVEMFYCTEMNSSSSLTMTPARSSLPIINSTQNISIF